MMCFSIGVLLISGFWLGPAGKDLSAQDYARGGTPSTSVGAGTALVGITLEGTTGEGEERFVPHGIRHLKLSKRKDSDPLSGSGPTFWSALRKDSDSDSDSPVSFYCSTFFPNPHDYISTCVSYAEP